MNRKVVKPMNETRPNRAFFRVTDEKLKLLNKRIKESGMTRQDWIPLVPLPYWNTIDIIKNNKGMDMDSKKLNVYGRTIGEEAVSKYK